MSIAPAPTKLLPSEAPPPTALLPSEAPPPTALLPSEAAPPTALLPSEAAPPTALLPSEAPPPTALLPSELWLLILQHAEDAVAGAALIAALGPRQLAPDDCEPFWRAWALRRWHTAPRSVPQPWRRYYAARLARERALPRIFYVAVFDGVGRVVAEANVAPGDYPERFRALCVVGFVNRTASSLWETHTSNELSEAHELALKRPSYTADGLPCTRNYEALLFCSLRVGEGASRQRLGCIVAHFAGGDWRREASAHAEAFLRSVQERFLYQLHASRLPPLPATMDFGPWPTTDEAQQQPQQQPPGDALARALRELAVEPAVAATAGRVELDLEYALELELDAWHTYKGVPLLPLLPPRPTGVPVSARVEVARARAEARAAGAAGAAAAAAAPPPPHAASTTSALQAGIERLSLAQSELLLQMQRMATRQAAELAGAVCGTSKD